ncbi:hypothetical protein EV182_000158 [Spiromyces aspiralis]|uniref:Uncharacterized protein n=1 Tax=Spiromyces aspiralis TaxID=68401 RepID=A0ACC1HHC2_9FUNG|nr:hypothetical protein EV182_000158 [Spiromyces aspiralis]
MLDLGLCKPVKLEYTLAKSEMPSNLPPMVVMHGLFGSKQNWGSLSKMFARRLNRDVYSVDLRNHGESPHALSHTYTSMAADIDRFMDDHGIKRATILGHSMGGKVAMYFALLTPNPTKIESLIVEDMSPVEMRLSHDFQNYIVGLREIENSNLGSQKSADQVLQKYEPDIGIRQFLLTNMKRHNGTRYYRSRVPLDTLEDSLEHLGEWQIPKVRDDGSKYQYCGPTLFINGERSTYINPGLHSQISSFFPNSQIKSLNTGHWGR